MHDELFQKTIIIRLTALEANQSRLEERLEEFVEAHNKMAAGVKDLVDLMESFKGAMKVIDLIGKFAKPIGYIATAVAAVVALFHFKK